MTAIEWQLFVAALGYWHSDKVLTHQQQYPYNSRQKRNSSDTNFIPHDEHVFVFAYSLCGLYRPRAIAYTKPETIFVAIRDILIRVLCQLPIVAST